MSHPSTLASVRKLIEQTRSDLERFAADIAVVAPASRISPHHRLADLREALRLLDTLTPPKTPANPVEALHVSLDYGADRSWPRALRELMAQLLPEMRIAAQWQTDDGGSLTTRYSACGCGVVTRARLTGQRWSVIYPRESGPYLALEDAQAAGDQMVGDEWALCGGAVQPQNAVASSGTNVRVEIPVESEWAPATEHVTQPEEQPDASWLRFVDTRSIVTGEDEWVYEGPVAVQLATAVDGNIPLLSWPRDGRAFADEPDAFIRAGQMWTRIVTRMPLVGAVEVCDGCGVPDGSVRVASQRLLSGEVRVVCDRCADAIEELAEGIT